MEYHVIHEKELGQRADLAGLIDRIDRERPPVGYERLLYPWFLVIPERRSYTRMILDDTERLIVPLLPVDEPTYDRLDDFARGSGREILLVDRRHEWMVRRGMRLVPVGALQNIELAGFELRGTRMRKLRYMVQRFANSGNARTIEYGAETHPSAEETVALMAAWARSKNNVIWHTALCMEHLLKGELPPGHRAFLTYLDDRLCSIIVIEAWENTGYLMDQEFYDPGAAPLGHMEYAIVEMMRLLKSEGMEVLSLGATWYPFPFDGAPDADPDGWAWLMQHQGRSTLLGKIFEQGQSNYQFKKKFGVAGEPLFAYLPAGKPFGTVLHYWSVFYTHSLTPPQLEERLRQAAAIPSAPPPDAPAFERPEERQAAWDRASRFEEVPYSASPLDLMTDSWFGRESAWVHQRLAKLESHPVPDPLARIREVFPFEHLFPTPQGRDAEALFYSQFPKSKRRILTTIPWTSTLGNRLAQGFESVELLPLQSAESSSASLFQGECDLSALETYLETHAREVAMMGIEVLNNGTGGHPVRLSHLRKLKGLLTRYAVPLAIDASRVVRNALLLKQHDAECADRDVWWLVRETLLQADYVVTSLTKDFGVPVGGLIATNDTALAARIREARASSAPSERVAPLLAASLADRTSLVSLAEEQMALTKSLQGRLRSCGLPVVGPAFGHAIVLDCEALLPDAVSKPARERFLRDLFIQTGIRAGIHQAGQQRQGALVRGIRLAFPLGLTRAHEDRLFEALRGFLEPRLRALEPAAPPAPLVDDFSSYLDAEATRALISTPAVEPDGEVAIVGLNGRYPGADDHLEFWSGLREGRNFVGPVPQERWNHADCLDATLPKAFVPGRTRCRHGAFLRSADRFDAAFFNLTPTEALLMDPQERLALETVWGCLEDAGYAPARLGSDVGLFAGMTYNEYQKLVPRTTHSCYLTSRLAYFLNFQGPAAALDTGCASSLAAIDAACQNLRNGRCRAAVVIGANLILHPDHYASLSPELSTSDRPESVPFGDADGWIPAEGVVAILLKPQADALRDGDHIYATIKACGTGHEGKTSWFSAFSPARQAAFLRRSFETAGISPTTISYVEAAANGSPLGDAIELEGLTTAFRHWTDRRQYCPLGTVKANVGHGESVSTLLQLTRVLLQFQTREIYPLLHPERRNPNLRIEETPFRFPVTTEVWERPTVEIQGKRFAVPRRASISSFGGGGNMGHLILEEPPEIEERPDSLTAYLIPMSARTSAALTEAVGELASYLEQVERFDPNAASNYRLMNVMRTLWEGRVAFPERVAFVVADLAALKEKCGKFLRHEPDPDILTKEQPWVDGGDDTTHLISTQAWRALGARWVAGEEIHWGDFFASRKARRVSLSTYPFERQVYPICGTELQRRFEPRTSGSSEAPQPEPRSVPSAQPSMDDSGVETLVKRAFAGALGVEAGALDLHRPLDQYGFDSALVVSVAAELEKHFEHVPATLFFDCGAIGEVVEYVKDRLTPRQRPKVVSPAADVCPASGPEQSGLDFDRVAEGILSGRLRIDQVLEQLK